MNEMTWEWVSHSQEDGIHMFEVENVSKIEFKTISNEIDGTLEIISHVCSFRKG